MATITCTVSGVKYTLHPAPRELWWPHPALSYGLDFPKPRTPQEHILCMGAYLMHLSTSGIVRLGEPLRPQRFSPIWLATAIPVLKELATYIRTMGADRLPFYPVLVLGDSITSNNIESWIDECYHIKKTYDVLSTPERDEMNERHRILVAARNHATQQDPVQRLSFNQYLERAAIDCGLDDEARYTFFRVCKNPKGSSDRAIKSVICQLSDWAPQETIDDQLNFDSLIQRLMDAMLDNKMHETAKVAYWNSELSKGMFRERPLTSSLMKKKAQAKTINALQELLAKINKTT